MKPIKASLHALRPRRKALHAAACLAIALAEAENRASWYAVPLHIVPRFALTDLSSILSSDLSAVVQQARSAEEEARRRGGGFVILMKKIRFFI